MATTIIPEKRIITCDCCGWELNHEVWAISNSRLIFKRDVVDMQGCACADATVTLDLCDRCADRIGEAINAKCNEIHNLEGRKK